MAEEIKKVINIQVKGGDSMKLLQKEIKSLKGQLLDLEEGSEEYARVLSEVADKTLKLKDMNEAVRYSAMDMGARLQNIGRVAAGVVGGFNALQGALALFGKESEDLQKVMVKLQAGIAIVQGLQALEDLTKSIPALIANFKGFGTAVSGFFNNLFGKMDPFEKRVKGIAADLSGIGNVNLNASASASTGGNITNINAAAANKTLVPLNKMSSLHKSMIKDLQKQLQIEKARLATLEEQRAKFSEIAKEANREALKNKENLSTADLEDYIKIRDAAHKNIKETDVDIKKVKDNIKLMDAAVAQASKSTNLFARS